MWRQHFVVEESMLELETSCLTPEVVLQASGHVDSFTDLMVTDAVTGRCERADYLLESRLNELLGSTNPAPSDEMRFELMLLRERLDELGEEEMNACLATYEVISPDGNAITPAKPFNLLFETSIGPSGRVPGYLRPENAQGIFVNFKKLLEYTGGDLPFACAQVGLSFRNEISPLSGLLRLREFDQAEIEHFHNPNERAHPKFKYVRKEMLSLYGREQQVRSPFKPVHMTIGEAVDTGIVANETLGYFIARTNQFAAKIGLKKQFVRFRQHLEHELAHYAQACWELEVESSYGWTDCASISDRGAFDLKNHSEKSGQMLEYREDFAKEKKVLSLVCAPKKDVLGQAFRRNAQVIMRALEEMDEDEVRALQMQMKAEGKVDVSGFEILPEYVSFKKGWKSVSGRRFFPSVIEPSFRIGRLLYCLLEHSYYARAGSVRSEERKVLALKPAIAPVKCAVLPLSPDAMFHETLASLTRELGKAGLVNRIDDVEQSIGRRQARADEIGTPYCISVDFQTVEDGSVSVRERDSMKQVRCTKGEAVKAVADMVNGRRSWKEVRGAVRRRRAKLGCTLWCCGLRVV